MLPGCAQIGTFFLCFGRLLYALLGHWWYVARWLGPTAPLTANSVCLTVRIGPCFLAKRSVTPKDKERNGTCRGLARFLGHSTFEFGRALVLMFYDLALLLRSVGIVILGIRCVRRGTPHCFL